MVFHVLKTINNNIVSCLDENKQEHIVMGRGLGFGVKQGAVIDQERVEKVFSISNPANLEQLKDLLARCPQPQVEFCTELIQYATQVLDHPLNEGIYLTLCDHICFAIERYEQGIDLPYLMLAETRLLYPREFEAGRWALDQIELRCGVRLPDYEAGYIALQLASASMNREMTYNTLKLTKGCMDIIRDTYGVELDPDQIDTVRLTTHLKFLAQRIFQQVQWTDDDMEGLHEMLLKKHKQNRKCMERLKEYIRDNFDYTLNAQEEVYLLVHLSKIFY